MKIEELNNQFQKYGKYFITVQNGIFFGEDFRDGKRGEIQTIYSLKKDTFQITIKWDISEEKYDFMFGAETGLSYNQDENNKNGDRDLLLSFFFINHHN